MSPSVAWRIESSIQGGSGFESGRVLMFLFIYLFILSKKRVLKFLGHTSLFSKSVPRLLWVLTWSGANLKIEIDNNISVRNKFEMAYLRAKRCHRQTTPIMYSYFEKGCLKKGEGDDPKR